MAAARGRRGPAALPRRRWGAALLALLLAAASAPGADAGRLDVLGVMLSHHGARIPSMRAAC